MTNAKRLIVAITGASGSLYALALLKILEQAGVESHGIISAAGRQVLKLELDRTPADLPGVTRWHDINDLAAPMASGSAPFDGMVVVPCTMGTLAAIASGAGRNLIHRAADVTLKEGRPLLLAVRETPLNRIHLENMLRAQAAGAVICPPMPAFYTKPTDLADMAHGFAARLADLLKVEAPDAKRWGLNSC
ncbi:MAG: aromatic acid decarboxylase [Deltaproteobacteria bacterium CG_4_10_14_3_um_filter_60_8]|nr:MAG: aromatic acid decarboxylase [Desulfobacterales bacterium CG2_30_60_27]PIP44571.1 MAG: aromatic acid decarboxylase [Deltaproteobacteria bacterium CG23_combo_of_CG06-09_8_20_14_all_60_8]PIY21783.1 MAG: aromatic acid decarboxylase [Deltaproteobacteria bacterium CG_4_10_14_3_um_filter_60_8]